MKKLAFLITALNLLNGNVNAFGEDDLDYQEELRQLEAENAKDLENLNTLTQHLETPDINDKNEKTIWKYAFIVENIISPAHKKENNTKIKINQLKLKKLREEDPYLNNLFNANVDDLLKNMD
ncbi:MAG: hypothetical protein Q8K37_01900 [Alphaproteobacteria bacterium]|nr:hypothetical protein [Alphaproteobacteria bacterium]